jgi:hypothetical protein
VRKDFLSLGSPPAGLNPQIGASEIRIDALQYVSLILLIAYSESLCHRVKVYTPFCARSGVKLFEEQGPTGNRARELEKVFFSKFSKKGYSAHNATD